MTIEELLIFGKSHCHSEHAKILLAEVLGKEKEYLLIHDNDELDAKVIDTYNKMIERLKSGEPVQYILNKQD